MQKLLEDIVKSIVDKPDEVQVNVNESENTIVYELNVGDGDLGKVIGKKGKNVNSIRTLLSASNAKEGGKRAILEIIE
ncbi:MAG: RNA-binding protein [Candidatus Marinimicrobia bacterium]|nr:RNA-binding protein [Candidatus Neomarinimicrobiota bacterium]